MTQIKGTDIIMANRHNHYESAFEAYLRQKQIPYMAIDETKRPKVTNGSLKNLDFIVSPTGTSGLLTDVKGRLFPTGSHKKQYWKNWITIDDLDSMIHWQKLYGSGFIALVVFAYNVVGDLAPVPEDGLFEWKSERYAFLAVRLNDYLLHAKPLSIKWKTISLPTKTFRQLAVPVENFFIPAAEEINLFSDEIS
jgi:hypothetical protein